MQGFDQYLDWCAEMAASDLEDEDEGPDPDEAYDQMRDDRDA